MGFPGPGVEQASTICERCQLDGRDRLGWAAWGRGAPVLLESGPGNNYQIVSVVRGGWYVA